MLHADTRYYLSGNLLGKIKHPPGKLIRVEVIVDQSWEWSVTRSQFEI